VQIKSFREGEFRKRLESSDSISWLSKLTGIWSFGFSIIGKNKEEIQNKFLQLLEEFQEDIQDYRLLIHQRSSFFFEKILEQEAEHILRNFAEPEQIDLDKIDKVILKELTQNSRIRLLELAEKVNLTAQATGKRIKRLEQELTLKYTTLVNLEKLGIYQYSIFIKNKNIQGRKALINYLKTHPKVTFVAEYIGDEFIEYGLFAKDPYEVRSYIKEIEEAFPDSRTLEISLFQQDIKSIRPPECVFE
jgi:DNA-binding Lrp family transcriptional regulator